MPSHPPRSDATKKREQLQRREHELEHALRSGFSREKLVRAAEDLRAAHLSLLKAGLYWAQDEKVRGRDVEDRIRKIEDDTRRWQQISVDEILHHNMA